MLGGLDLVKGAVNPEEAYSKEHWLNSMGVFALLTGIRTPSLIDKWNETRLGMNKGDAGQTVGEKGKIDAKGTGETASYYRVQGGEMPNASQIRIQVDNNVKMVIPNKDANLNVSAGTREHAEYFLQKRGNGAEIVEVEVPRWFNDFVKENAIPQYKYNSNPLNQGGQHQK